MADNTDRVDVVVVGAGLAGLICGTLAAGGGARTLVLDAHRGGGRARTTDRDGFLFNEGPHALFESGALRTVLRGLGVRPAGAPPALAGYRVARGAERHPLPRTAAQLARSRMLSLRGKAVAARVLNGLPRLDPAALAGRSVTEWCDDQGLPPDVRALLLMMVRVVTYVDAPDLLDAGAAVGQLQATLAQSVRYLDGGWQTIVDGLARALATAGGELRPGVRVDAVTSDGWQATVKTSAGDLRTRAVVIAGLGPAESARLLGEGSGWLGDLGPAVEAACLQLGVVRAPEPPVLFGLDEPLYLSAHAPVARLAPPGRAMVEVMKYLSPGAGDGAEPVRDELVALRRRAGIADADVLDERFLRRMTVAHAMPLARRGGLAGRPPVTAPGRGNVFLAGDWVGPVGMLSDASAASAQHAAREALDLLALVGAS
jgi:phytoene dehydrogenase-like protein